MASHKKVLSGVAAPPSDNTRGALLSKKNNLPRLLGLDSNQQPTDVSPNNSSGSRDSSYPVNLVSRAEAATSALNPQQLKARPIPGARPVKFYPAPLLQADSLRLSRGWRLWILAKHIDTKGRGIIAQESLRRTALEHISEPTYRRYLKQAFAMGLFDHWAQGLHITGRPRAFRKHRVAFVDTRRAVMPLAALFGPGWKARVFDAFHAAHGDKPISRSTIASMTSKPKTTQRRYEKHAGTRARRNIVVYDLPANWEWIRYQEVEHGRYYTEYQGSLARPLPNIYTPASAKASKKGRSRKIRKDLSSFWGRDKVVRYTNGPMQAKGWAKRHDGTAYYPRKVMSDMTIWGIIQA